MIKYETLNAKVRLRVKELYMTEKRLAVLSIIVEDRSASAEINALLSEFGDYIVGRLGVPYREKKVSVMSVIVDAPTELINTLTGRIGMIAGVTAKTLMSKV